MNSTTRLQPLSFLTLIFLLQLDTAAAQQAVQPKRGEACTVLHPANNSGCRKMEGTKGPLYFVADEGAFKTCATSTSRDTSCLEAPRATHRLTLYADAKCTRRIRRIILEQNRCDFKK